jgi:PEGA domain
MKRLLIPLIPFLLTGCASLPKFSMTIDSDPEGCRVEVNGEYIGMTPTSYTIRGNGDRSFNGAWVQGKDILFTATPPYGQTNLYVQTKSFSPSAFFKQGDHIPERMFFDMHVKPRAVNNDQILINIDSK